MVSWRGDVDAIELAAAVEAASSHPIARALHGHGVRAALPIVLDVREELARGVRDQVAGRDVVVGAPAWVRAREAADVYLRSSSIRELAATAAGAQATLATIRRNLRCSLVYNLVAGVLAVSGLIHPMIAAAVMPLSSLTVLASSLRSKAFRS